MIGAQEHDELRGLHGFFGAFPHSCVNRSAARVIDVRTHQPAVVGSGRSRNGVDDFRRVDVTLQEKLKLFGVGGIRLTGQRRRPGRGLAVLRQSPLMRIDESLILKEQGLIQGGQ